MPEKSTTNSLQEQLNRTVTVTRFNNRSGSRKKTLNTSIRELLAMIEETSADHKDNLPMLKFGTFGNKRTAKNCLRSNDNMKTITGVEGDYDAEVMTFDEACDRATHAGIQAIIYETSSATDKRHRWRIFCPFLESYHPDCRTEFAEQLNAVYDAQLAQGETFSKSQSFYYGKEIGTRDRRIKYIPGQPLDCMPDLPRTPKLANAKDSSHEGDERDNSGSAQLFRLAYDVARSGGSFTDFEVAILDNKAAADHVKKQADSERAIKRAWLKNTGKWEKERQELIDTFEDLPPLLDDCSKVPIGEYLWISRVFEKEIICLF